MQSILCLRTCALDGSSLSEDATKGFRWPLTIGARVKPTHWSPTPDCIGGLHGIQIGKHSGSALLYPLDSDVLWLVFRVIGSHVEVNGNKIKCEEAEVMEYGTKDEILASLAKQGYVGLPYSKNTGGDCSTNTGGNYSKCSGGLDSQLLIQWHDGKRYRTAVAYVGEDGIEPNVLYCVKDGKFVKA